MLGDDPAVFDKFAAAEPKLFKAECGDDDGGDECRDLKASVKNHLARIKALSARAVAAKACHGDPELWAKRLDDPDEGVRERAAYEVGRGAQGALVGELLKRMSEKNLDTRLAFIQGADWLVHDAPEAMAEGKKRLPELAKQIAEEKGKTEFDKVNEDLRRLYAQLAR